MLKLTIPTPCHENWDKMTASQQGRHCNSCMKTVVDFTAMSDDEVKNFFLNTNKKEEPVCGRFNNNQLHRIQIELPANIFQLQMPWWKRFLVASLVVFSTTLFSCEIKHTQSKDNSGLRGLVGRVAAPDSTKYTNPLDSSFPVRQRNTFYPTKLLGYTVVKLIDESVKDSVTMVPPITCNSTGDNNITVGMLAIKVDSVNEKRINEFIKGEVNIVPDSIRNPGKKDVADSSKCNSFL